MCSVIKKIGFLYRNASEWTPLHCAAAGGFDKVVSLLIEARADVDSSDCKVRVLFMAEPENPAISA